MFSTILEAVTPKFTSLNKKAVLKSKTFLFNSLENEVLPALDVFISSNIKALSKNKFLSNSFSLMGIKSSNSLDGVKELRDIFQNTSSEKWANELKKQLYNNPHFSGIVSLPIEQDTQYTGHSVEENRIVLTYMLNKTHLEYS